METEVVEELVKEKAPDIFIAATGALPIVPPIPGTELPMVVTAHDVLERKANTGARVVVIGGGNVGAETANHLASNLKNVTLVEMLEDIATDELVVPRWRLLADMEKNKVRICTKTRVTKIVAEGVVVEGETEGILPCDTVVLSVGAKPNTTLADKLTAVGYDVRIVGDAQKVGLASKAIRDGFHLGRSL